MFIRPSVMIRDSDNTDSPLTDSDDNMVSVRMYHGGIMKRLPNTEYVGGELTVYDLHGLETISIEEIKDFVNGLGYSGLKNILFRIPTKPMNTGLIPLNNQSDVNMMLGYAEENNYRIDVFVEHYTEETLSKEDYENLCPDDYEGNDSNDHYLSEENDSDFDDSEYSMTDEDDDNIFAENVDANVEWIGRIKFGLGLESDGDDSDYNIGTKSMEEDASDSDSLDSLFENMCDKNISGLKKIIWPVYKDSDVSKWEVGMIFKDPSECRQAIIKHSYTEGRMVSFALSDRKRVKAVCKQPCPWYVFASVNFDKSFQLKQVGPAHTCVREQKGLPLVHSGFLASKYMNDFRMNPTWPIDAFHKKVIEDLQIDFKAHVLRRAKRKAMMMINGTDADQFSKLWDYKAELLSRNPNSTIEIEFEQGQPGVFKRMYICFGGLKHGFKLACRKVIGLDGTHIKNFYKGQILTAVGVDPNNSMYPVAYAVVESEKLESWDWFLKLFQSDFDMGCGEGWTIISDRQKGLLNVVQNLLPSAEHRFCVRHMHNNFKQKHPGRSLKEKMWSAARAPNVQNFNERMEFVKSESPEAFEWLTAVPSHHWTRSHFKAENKCDILLNNMCESFNRSIVFARQQGILVMLEMIREYLMKRLQSKRDKASCWDKLVVTPKARQLVEKFKKWSGGCYSAYAGYNQFEISTVSGNKFAVDLNSKTCACRRWDLTGIPCHHAVSGINRLGQDVYDYVDAAYSIKAYMNCYSGIIHPMNGESQWNKTGFIIKPPIIQKQPGRPKAKRRHDGNDVNDLHKETENGVKVLKKKAQFTVRCSECKQTGHNKRTCKDRQSSTTEAPFHFTDETLDSIIEMDVGEGPSMTQPSQESQVHFTTSQPTIEIEWPIVTVPTITEWPAWPCVTEKLSVPFHLPAADRDMKRKGKLVSRGGKALNIFNKMPCTSINKTQPLPECYTGPNLHGLIREPMVKQFKTVVGGVQLETASFLKSGTFVFTTGTITKAREEAVKASQGNKDHDKVDAEADADKVVEVDVDMAADAVGK